MKTLLTILFLLLPVVAWAADGDEVDSGTVDVTKGSGSFESKTYILCDGVLGSDAACDEFDLQTIGMPDYFIFSRDAVDSDCTGDVTVTINGQTTTGGTEHAITVLNDATTSQRVEGPRNRFIDATLTNVAGCEDGAGDTGVDVNMTIFFERK